MNQSPIKIRSAFRPCPVPGEIIPDVTKTIEGQSYSVADALRRVQQGLPVISGRRYAYAEEGDESIPMRMRDLTDIDAAKNDLQTLQKEFAEKRKKIKEAAKKAAEEAVKAP